MRQPWLGRFERSITYHSQERYSCSKVARQSWPSFCACRCERLELLQGRSRFVRLLHVFGPCESSGRCTDVTIGHAFSAVASYNRSCLLLASAPTRAKITGYVGALTRSAGTPHPDFIYVSRSFATRGVPVGAKRGTSALHAGSMQAG